MFSVVNCGGENWFSFVSNCGTCSGFEEISDSSIRNLDNLSVRLNNSCIICHALLCF